MTIKELKEKMVVWGEVYYEIEVYRPTFSRVNHFHTDNCRFVEDYNDDMEVDFWELMNLDDYNHSILANACEFAEDYFEPNDKILCVMIKGEKEDVVNEIDE